MAKCKTCKHKGTSTHICDECACDYSMYEKKVTTNADRIRSMTDEEMAEFFDSGLRFVCSDFHCEECFNGLNCDVCYLEWLQSEAE